MDAVGIPAAAEGDHGVPAKRCVKKLFDILHYFLENYLENHFLFAMPEKAEYCAGSAMDYIKSLLFLFPVIIG